MKAAARRLVARLPLSLSFHEVSARQAVRLAYNIVLDRDPQPAEEAAVIGRIGSGELPRDEFVAQLRGSEEFRRVAFDRRTLPQSLHMSRCDFIRMLPPARRIIDLGGAHWHDASGALVAMGYPYRFESLTVVDLPSAERHEMYRSAEYSAVESERGRVTYVYRSMDELDDFDDTCADLVYLGQAIEHVGPDAGARVVRHIERMLAPGGYLALDTPNGRVTRRQQPEFIDPDHKVEYTPEELDSLLATAPSLQPVLKMGLNYCGEAGARREFDWDEAARNTGVYFDPAECYLLASVYRKR